MGRRDLNLWSSFRTRKNVRVEFLPVIHGFFNGTFWKCQNSCFIDFIWEVAVTVCRHYGENNKFNQIVIVSECTNYVDMWGYDYD